MGKQEILFCSISFQSFECSHDSVVDDLYLIVSHLFVKFLNDNNFISAYILFICFSLNRFVMHQIIEQFTYIQQTLYAWVYVGEKGVLFE